MIVLPLRIFDEEKWSGRFKLIHRRKLMIVIAVYYFNEIAQFPKFGMTSAIPKVLHSLVI